MTDQLDNNFDPDGTLDKIGELLNDFSQNPAWSNQVRVLSQIKMELQMLHESGKIEGFKEGYEEGYKKGIEKLEI